MTVSRLAVSMGVFSALALTTSSAHAETPAGTIIVNQAHATYFDPVADRNFAVTSTIATVRVNTLLNFDLQRSHTIESTADQLVFFSHTLYNSGNEADSFAISGIPGESSASLTHLVVHADLNENGTLDSGEPVINRVDNLPPGQASALLLCGRVPSAALIGDIYSAQIQAQSEQMPDRMQRQTDIVEVGAMPEFSIVKSAVPNCSTPVSPGELIDYQLNLLHLENLVKYARIHEIGSESMRGFLLEDEIPANTSLVAGGTEIVAPAAGFLVVRDVASGKLRRYASFEDTQLVRSVGFFLPEASLGVGQSGRFEFQVRVADDITPGTVVNNILEVDLEGDGVIDVRSNPVCNTLEASSAAGNSAQLRFLSPLKESSTQSTGSSAPRSFVDASQYVLDGAPNYTIERDGVYLEVRSTAMNEAAWRADEEVAQQFIRVKVESRETGDSIFVRMQETGVNTGLFRSLEPFALSEAGRGRGQDCGPRTIDQCILRSEPGDQIQATIFDLGVQAQLVDLAAVNPRGLVFNAASLAPVAGASVAFHTADGALARDPTTGTTIPTQITGEDGQYSLPVFEDGNYYIEVTPPQEFAFPSRVEADVFASRRHVGDYSYGRDGFTSTSAQGVFTAGSDVLPQVIDLPIDPNLQTGQLQLEKTVDQDFASFGDSVTYTLRLTNNTDATLLATKIEDMPAPGLRFVTGTLTLDGDPLAPVRDGRKLVIPIGRLEAGETTEVTYNMRVGPEAGQGDVINVAIASGRTGGNLIARSPEARAVLSLRSEGLLSDRGYIIGTVWQDLDKDEEHDEDEPGIPFARIWLENGAWVDTDENGHYSFYGILPGQRIARLDPETLPNGYIASGASPRHAMNGQARFTFVEPGHMARANFPINCETDDLCDADILRAELEARAELTNPEDIIDTAMRFEGIHRGTGERVFDLAQNQHAGPDGDLGAGSLGEGNALRGRFLDTIGGSRPVMHIGTDTLRQNEERMPPDPETIAQDLEEFDISKGLWVWPPVEGEFNIRYARGGPIMLAVRAGLSPELYIDGELIGDESLGAVIVNRRIGAQIAAWYGMELTPGPHQVEVRGTDDFGNDRLLAAGEIIRPGDVQELTLEPIGNVFHADGHSRTKYRVRALDAAGHPAMGTHFLTLRAEMEGINGALDFAGRDLQEDTEGFQIRLQDGQAIVELPAPSNPGIIRVEVEDGGRLSARSIVRFSTPIRPLMAVGLIDVTARGFEIEGDLAPANADAFPEKLETDGRVALFLKGQIRGDMLLTLAYDSEKSDQDGLFRDIDPENYYPIYGDGGERGYEGQSRSKLYVRLERGESSAMWGDFRTDTIAPNSLTNRRLAMTGVNLTLQGEVNSARIYAGEGQNQRQSLRFRGRGIATGYSIPGAPIVNGSEILTVEVRGKDNPGWVLSETVLERFSDYLIDPLTGRVTLKDSLPSIDADGNLVYLQITYETRDQELSGIVAGVRLEHQRGDTILFGNATHDSSEIGIESRTALSLGGEKVWEHGRIYAEAGVMDTKDETGGIKSGIAMQAGITLEGDRTSFNLEYGEAASGFDNRDAAITAGRREIRTQTTYEISRQIGVQANATHSTDLETDAERATLEALWDYQGERNSVAMGLRYQSEATPNGATMVEQESLSGVLRLRRSLTLLGQASSVYAEGEYAVNGDGARVTIGADSSLSDKTRIYLQHRILDSLPDQTFAGGLASGQARLRQGRTVAGVETSLLPSTQAFGEWRQGTSLDSRTGEAAYGIRADWELRDGLSFSPAFEVTKTFNDGDVYPVDEEEGTASVSGLTSTQDATSLSLAVADRRDPMSRKSSRIEMRLSDHSHYYAARMGWAERFTPELMGAVKVEASRDNIQRGPDAQRAQTTLGLARRPNVSDRADWLALYQFQAIQQAGNDRKVHLVSAHMNRQVGRNWEVSTRVAAKWEDYNGTSGSAQLIGARILHSFIDNWELEANAAWRGTDMNESSQIRFGLGGAYRVNDHVRVGGGFNFTGFRDRDLDPSGYDARGLYARLTIAIDEDWLSWLSPDGEG